MLPDHRELWWTTSAAHNIYPKEVPSYAKYNVELTRAMRNLGGQLIAPLADYLGAKGSLLKAMALDSQAHFNGSMNAWSLHYAPYSAEVMDKLGVINRLVAHQDPAFFTLLPQSSGAGLQLLQNDGSWLDVSAEKEMIIMNAGDTLKLVTEGLVNEKGESRAIPSKTHRVMGNRKTALKDRYSMPFFFNLNLEKPYLNLQTGKPIHLKSTTIGKGFEVTIDKAGYQLMYVRSKAGGQINPNMTYEAFVDSQRNMGQELQKAVADSNLQGYKLLP